MTHHFTALSNQATTIGSSSGIGSPHLFVPRLLGAVVTLLIMLTLKRHYSLATADQLTWILAPTARLVAWFTSAHPAYEQGVGYADFAAGIIIAPACAGLNFMIMAFGLAAFCGLIKIRRMPILLAWLVVALGSAYGYTLMVNGIRISLSMALYKADIYGGWLTMERVHRLAGIGLYIGALWLFFVGLQTIINRYCRRLPGQDQKRECALPDWLPFGWYAAGTAGVPLANLLFRQRAPALVEHCLTIGITVIFISTITWAAKGAITHLWRRLKPRARKDMKIHASQCVDC